MKMVVSFVSRMLKSTMRLERRLFGTTSVNKSLITETSDVQMEGLDNDICLLVDEKDNILGTATKRECHRVADDGKILLHRAFSVFVFNKKNEILIQRRASEKVTYPDYYSNACCSHPLFIDNKPEGIIEAAQRRLHHELGIPFEQMKPELFTYMTRVHYHDPGNGVWGEHEMDYVLILHNDIEIKPNPNEISECVYVPKDELDSFIRNLKGPITPWFNMIRKHRLNIWWDNLHRIKDFQEQDTIHRFIENPK